MSLNPNKYSVKFFQVGNGSKGGDAILIELYDNEDNRYPILIDGGYKETGESICAYLKKNYEEPRICMMINTHPDKDHISGFMAILEDDDITVESIYMNRPWKDSHFSTEFFNDRRITEHSLMGRIRAAFLIADKIEELAKSKDIEISSLFCGSELINGVLTVLGPSQTFYRTHLLASDKTPESIFDEYNKPYQRVELGEEDYDTNGGVIAWIDEEQTSDVNQTSLILSLTIGTERFLFTGDAGKQAINEALNYYESLDKQNNAKDFTKVQLPHHGSRKNIDPAIIDRLSPESYIISCPPDGEKEGHPSRRLINKILELQPEADIYVTKSNSFIFHKGDGKTYNHQKPQTTYSRMDGRPII